MKTQTFDNNLFEKINDYLLNQLKAEKVDSFTNNIDEVYHVYSYNSKETEKIEITVHVKEDSLFGDSTSVHAPQDILKQINNLVKI